MCEKGFANVIFAVQTLSANTAKINQSYGMRLLVCMLSRFVP